MAERSRKASNIWKPPCVSLGTPTTSSISREVACRKESRIADADSELKLYKEIGVKSDDADRATAGRAPMIFFCREPS